MRIVFITHYASMFGANRSLLHLIRQLVKAHNIEPLIFCPEPGAFPEACRKEGYRVVVLPFNNAAYTIRSLKKLFLFPWLVRQTRLRWIPILNQEVGSFQPDLIHSNASVVDIGWQLAEHFQLPHLWHLREFGWNDYQLVYPMGKKRTLKHLSEAHGVVCISQTIKTAWSASLPAETLVLYNGIGSKAQLEQRYALSQNKNRETDSAFTFLIIGLLQPSKGQLEALRAFGRLYKTNRNLRLVVAGNGRWLYTRLLKMYTRFKGLNAVVQFTGYVADPSSLYTHADVVLMCSKTEAMGRVTAEAMSYGLPVVGYRGGATPELVDDGRNGMLYDDLEGLQSCMQRLWDMTASERSQMRRAAYETAVEKFTDEQYAASFYNFARQLVAIR